MKIKQSPDHVGTTLYAVGQWSPDGMKFHVFGEPVSDINKARKAAKAVCNSRGLQIVVITVLETWVCE